MRMLTVLYDDQCAFCVRCKQWAEAQPKYLTLRFLPRDGEQARALYPELAGQIGQEELLAIDDAGQVYRDSKAWVMCLYALREYRAMALRLGQPALRGFARRVFALISRHRRHLPRWLLATPPAQLRARLRHVPEPMRCESSMSSIDALRQVRRAGEQNPHAAKEAAS